MKILAFAASNSTTSINKKLAAKVAMSFQNDEIEIVDLNDYEMPIYSPNREKNDGVPALALKFARKIDSCDLIIISFAEHNGTYTAAFKNIFDWISRIKGRKAFGDKPMFLLSTSPGERGASGVLEMAVKRMPFSGGNVLQTFSLPKFNENFSDATGITDIVLQNELTEKIRLVKQALDNVPV